MSSETTKVVGSGPQRRYPSQHRARYSVVEGIGAASRYVKKFITGEERQERVSKSSTPLSHQKQKMPPPIPHQIDQAANPVTLRPNREDRGDHDDQSRQLFRDRRDRCSESEIIADCKSLNNKITDVALSIIDDWEKTLEQKDRVPSTVARNIRDRICLDLEPVIGRTLLGLIQQLANPHSSFSEELPNRIADALQTSAVFVSNWIISETFCPMLARECDSQFQIIFNHMVSHELQASALHWRAMTYVHAVHTASAAALETFTSTFHAQLVYCFKAVLVLAGENDSSPFLDHVQQVVLKSSIIDTAIQLGEKLKTNFFSTHLDTCLIRPNLPFDSSIMEADEVLGAPGPTYNCLAVCTVGLGIREIMSGKSAGGNGESGRILMKPRVLVGAVAPASSLNTEPKCHAERVGSFN